MAEPGACADPSCPVLHADPANPIHPLDYEPGGPMWDADDGIDYEHEAHTLAHPYWHEGCDDCVDRANRKEAMRG